MAHRLQMKLGVLPEADRLPDSGDTVLHVEPRIGAQARTKGHLYLLVTSRVEGRRARDATRLVADSIRAEYYYDETAGVRVCLAKAIVSANRRLSHARERSAVAAGVGADGSGPIGVGVAVVRDNELYVCTVGPAEAYLSRGARLSTLPDPHRDRGLPATELEPDVWRGEINVGDQLLLVSPAITERLGVDELKDALVTLHPQPAVEQLHSRYVAAGGAGSDGAITLEAGEVAVARSGRAPVAVRPAEPLAGVPDRSPIPLADSVAGGVAAAQSAAVSARAAAGGLLGRLLRRLQDALPARAPGQRQVTPMTARREMQQRAAIAILSIIAVIGVLGAGFYVLGEGQGLPRGAISSFEIGQQALQLAREDLARVRGPGIDLVTNDPRRASTLLAEVITKLDEAARAGIPASTIQPLRDDAMGLIDRLYKMVDVGDSVLYAFPEDQRVDLRAIVRGRDGAPYVLDAGTKSVYRVELAGQKVQTVFRAGNKAPGGTEGAPRLMAVSLRDIVILDSKSIVWRWRLANSSGRGTTARLRVTGSSEWGDDIRAIGTFVRNADAGLYNLYIVDPSEQQVLAYAPAIDGGSFPSLPAARLAAPRDVSGVTDLYIDGDIWLADSGRIVRVVNLGTEGWTAADPGDAVVRPNPRYTLVASGSDRREGNIYAFDAANGRVVAFVKSSGAFVGQYRLGGGSAAWADLRDWYVVRGIGDGPDTLVWITATAIHQTILEPLTTGPEASPGGSGEPMASPTPRPSKKR